MKAAVNVSTLAAVIETRLRRAADPERAVQEKRYLKSSLEHLGASMPAIHRVIKTVHAEHPELTLDDVVALSEELWAVPVHERRMAAVDLLERYADALPVSTLTLVERLLRESRGWALVDGLAASVTGPMYVAHPAAVGRTLDRWARDADFWLRRSALLAMLPALRHGDERERQQAFGRFARYAERMLDETEFFIRKAIGWVLRETAKRRPDLVEPWVEARIGRLSGLSVREAIKPLSAAVKERLAVAHQRHRRG